MSFGHGISVQMILIFSIYCGNIVVDRYLQFSVKQDV